ncbi:MAG TPA: phosphoribosyltransferase family protein [Luteibaculaceae bacterium]|jgi:hypoxanthine phosphoribosyltransferase|nr:phosphoribosyltransferase family protein [Luteibaculaceae bacterium]
MSKLVRLGDKSFQQVIDYPTLEEKIREMADNISNDYADRELFLLVVMNGAFPFAAELMKHLRVNTEVGFIKLSSYQATERGELTANLLTPLPKQGAILVLEDIVDSGNSIFFIRQLIGEQSMASVKIASLLHKPKACRSDVQVDYIGFSIENDFVIGFGLDYDHLGRTLKGIYQLTD